MNGAICGVSRGQYITPIPIHEAKMNWVDEECNSISIPAKYACQHDSHWKWGKGTRNGQKLYLPTKTMFYQKWHLTDQELRAAMKAYDIFSLEMTGRIICKECADREKAG